MRRVLVRWIDAYSIDEWTDIKELEHCEDGQMCVTTGFLVRESQSAIFVANSVGGQDACCIIVIPKAFIREIQDNGEGIINDRR